MQGPSPVHMEVQCRAHLQCTWRSSPSPVHLVQGSSPVHMEAQCKAISSSHEGPVQGPSPVNMEVQCRAHLQFTWRPNAGSISSSYGGPMQGPSPVHMPYFSTANGMQDQPIIWVHWSGAYGPLLQGLLHQCGDTTHPRWQGRGVM